VDEEDYIDFLYTFTIAIYSLGGLIGSLLVSFMVDRYGRKGALVINNIMSIFSAGFMGCSAVIHAYEYTIFSRLVTGMCSGMFSCIVPLYLGEISPRNMRGSIMTVPMIFVTIGVMVSQILSLQELAGFWERVGLCVCQLLPHLLLLPPHPPSLPLFPNFPPHLPQNPTVNLNSLPLLWKGQAGEAVSTIPSLPGPFRNLHRVMLLRTKCSSILAT
uniref:Major facilitator superfamily (MFS) profile domain-containing protein n=1 Tax=Podarcis muralis TaxID=64176 RepID=A0A670J9J7_PODMU